MRQLFLFFAGCIPAIVLFAAVSFERWQRKRKGERPPFSEKLLRPAGYGLQCKLEDLNDSYSAWFVGTFLSSLFAVGGLQVAVNDGMCRIIFLVLFGMVAIVCALMTWRRLMDIRSYRRGLLGEQAIAEQLHSLLAFGCRIFHDIPGDGKWNVDHVVVGPTGVFAIETKYRTKQPGKNSEQDHVVEFDGDKIQFPSGYDTKALEQARQNARWLATLLTKATGERVRVQPVVALPGWWVNLKTNSDMKVLSGKQLCGFITKEPTQLSTKFIQQISHQLDQRCRDVES